MIRPAAADDVPALKRVADGTGLFPGELLPDMISGFLADPSGQDIWLTCEHNGTAIGFCYAVPEKLADGTWNMLALAVLPSSQRQGAGRAIVGQLEKRLRDAGYRLLIAETSGTAEFETARAFYRRCGYAEEARIRDFWAAGNDKIVYSKAL
jgi:ribosomal protein S18 acetylase RimI-like enzyme